MIVMGRLIVNPAPLITMTQGITGSGVLGMMWMRRRDVMLLFPPDVEDRVDSSGTVFGADSDAVVVALVEHEVWND